MKFRTEIKKNRFPFYINHNDKIVMFGSCFSESISDRLKNFKFLVYSNPFGIMYNPISTENIIKRIIQEDHIKKEEFVLKNDIWHHFDLHGSYSGTNIDELLLKSKSQFIEYKSLLRKAQFIFITLGTANVYQRKDNKKIVANNHKFPPDFFIKKKLSIDEITGSLHSIIKILKTLNHSINIIFTVSPVRHIKDGLIENNRSKAKLILATEQLINNKEIFYFPAYELIIDDLRDYRFYANDLVHPSALAIDYVWNYFSEIFFDKNTAILNNKIKKIKKSLGHKPLFKHSKETQLFYASLKKEIEIFNRENPALKFDIPF